ncbi:MAG: hypothetical protein KatS3mg105_0476 [Gemmatales bacterium]|nr:MAG: hypothetical protein KatS3mg105_0476 [Gemmatales bacterium]
MYAASQRCLFALVAISVVIFYSGCADTKKKSSQKTSQAQNQQGKTGTSDKTEADKTDGKKTTAEKTTTEKTTGEKTEKTGGANGTKDGAPAKDGTKKTEPPQKDSKDLGKNDDEGTTSGSKTEKPVSDAEEKKVITAFLEKWWKTLAKGKNEEEQKELTEDMWFDPDLQKVYPKPEEIKVAEIRLINKKIPDENPSKVIEKSAQAVVNVKYNGLTKTLKIYMVKNKGDWYIQTNQDN